MNVHVLSSYMYVCVSPACLVTAEVRRGGGTAAAAAAAEQLTSQSCREGKPASCLTAEATAEQFNNSLGRKKDGRQRAIAS